MSTGKWPSPAETICGRCMMWHHAKPGCDFAPQPLWHHASNLLWLAYLFGASSLVNQWVIFMATTENWTKKEKRWATVLYSIYQCLCVKVDTVAFLYTLTQCCSESAKKSMAILRQTISRMWVERCWPPELIFLCQTRFSVLVHGKLTC